MRGGRAPPAETDNKRDAAVCFDCFVVQEARGADAPEPPEQYSGNTVSRYEIGQNTILKEKNQIAYTYTIKSNIQFCKALT